MSSEPLIHWPDPLIELLGFLSAMLAAGAVGFRLAALRPLFAAADGYGRDFARTAGRRAALLGLLGAGGSSVLVAMRLPELAARRHVGVPELLTSQPQTGLMVALLALAVVGFLLAGAGNGFGWGLATVAVLLRPMRAALFGDFDRIVNPMHELAAGLWIGTLFVLVAVGVTSALAGRLSTSERGEVVSRMVVGFSPLAQIAVLLLVTFGVITSWRHLPRLDALWTTPFGFALIVKLCVVAGVLALGAWNWRRQKPRLGTEAAAQNLRRSATAELALAGIVLVITSILVSLPEPH